MLFTDIIFLVFFVAVFVLYWLVARRSLRWQNLLLLAASYLFYGWWDWRFLGLIVLTSATTYATALAARGRWGRALTAANIVLNLGILFVFKYFQFFGENLSRLFRLCGWHLDGPVLDLLLPVGISFYTFQAISYSVDVFKRRMEPCADPVAFFTYIAYFPQLVAGPIERATQLLPQIRAPRVWEEGRAVSGLRMILFGVMKKLCVADVLALYVDRIFADALLDQPLLVLVAGVGFTLEIYCDFSAYSEIARGVSRLLGIELMANFRFPLFSRNILEFWQRWHISLMLWMRDYVYIPLGGNRKGMRRTVANTFAVFLLSGLWHGAGWNFVLWGAYWAVCYSVAKTVFSLKRPDRPIRKTDIPSMVLTFGMVSFGFYIFRCVRWDEIAYGFSYLWLYALSFALIGAMVRVKVFSEIKWRVAMVVASMVFFVCLIQGWYWWLRLWWLLPAVAVVWVEWRNRNGGYPMEVLCASRWGRYLFYWFCMAMVLVSESGDVAFIYFQF